MPKILNVADGTVSGTRYVNLSVGPRGTEISVNSTPAYVLFSDYILTAADGTMGEITMQFNAKSDAGKVLKKITIPAGIPTKRNYRVNAAGNLIQAEDEPSPTTEMTVAIEDTWLSPDENKDVVPVLDAKVGDYYYSDGTWSTDLDAGKTCIGIIFQVNLDGKSGKIVSLNESETKLAWATQGATNAAQATNATDLANGAVNMTTIKTLDPDYSDFPAFKWCADKSDGGLIWYLPAPHELQDLYAASCGLKIVDANPQAGEVERWSVTGGGNWLPNYSNYASQREAFKQRITTAKGTALSRYWSSYEDGVSYAVYISCNATSGGGGISSSEGKTFTNIVRAIAKFPKQ